MEHESIVEHGKHHHLAIIAGSTAKTSTAKTSTT